MLSIPAWPVSIHVVHLVYLLASDNPQLWGSC